MARRTAANRDLLATRKFVLFRALRSSDVTSLTCDAQLRRAARMAMSPGKISGVIDILPKDLRAVATFG
jgi:hypothetical protein